MIKAISSSNLKLTSKNSKNTNMANCNNHSQVNVANDIFIRSQKSKNISFSGYKGANGYGTQANRDALSYRVQLTPEIIKQSIQSASTVEQGIDKNYVLLGNEVKHYSQSLANALSISNDYSNVSVKRYNEIKKMAPKGANIWFIGAIPQWASVITGKFKQRVERNCTELTDDIDDIIHTHIFGNVESIMNGYNKAHDAFVETLPSLNNENKRRQYIKALDITGDRLNKNTALVCGIFNQKREIALANKAAVISSQHKAQVMRTGVKTVMNVLGGGLIGIAGVDEVIANAGIPIVSKVMGADLLGQAISVVSSNVIESVAWVTMEGLDSGNLAKESLSHSKSSNILKLTEKSLINVLRKIR